jgi:serine protease Do
MRTIFILGMAMAAATLMGPAASAQQSKTHISAVAVPANSPYLGIGTQDVDSERAKALKLKEDRGVEVTSVVDDSPAAKAGIKEGDVVLEYNGQAVESQAQLVRMVRETPVSRQVKIVVSRSGALQTLTATIERSKGMIFDAGNGTTAFVFPQMPSMPAMPEIEMPRFQIMGQSMRLGIEGEALGNEEQLAEFFGVKEGLLVKQVNRNSAAEKAGIKAGDVITKVDDEHVGNSRELTTALRSASKKAVTLTVVRNKQEMKITVTLDGSNGPAARASLERVVC